MKCTKTKPYIEEPIEGILLIAEYATRLANFFKSNKLPTLSENSIEQLNKLIELLKAENVDKQKVKEQLPTIMMIEDDLNEQIDNRSKKNNNISQIGNMLTEFSVELEQKSIDFDADDPMFFPDYAYETYSQLLLSMLSQLRVSCARYSIGREKTSVSYGYKLIQKVITKMRTRLNKRMHTLNIGTDNNSLVASFSNSLLFNISPLCDEFSRLELTNPKIYEGYEIILKMFGDIDAKIDELPESTINNDEKGTLHKMLERICQICTKYKRTPEQRAIYHANEAKFK